jgi:hypothetical protein
MLKINQEKTEFIGFSPKHQVANSTLYHLNFGDTIISVAPFVKNLIGVWFDNTLCMQKQILSVSCSCYQQLRNLGQIRSLITEDACIILVHVCALVTSRLDYANALLYGINKNVLAKLQKIQNMAARIIIRTYNSSVEIFTLASYRNVH